MLVYIVPDLVPVSALRKLKRLRAPPKHGDFSETALGSKTPGIQGADDPYFKYDIMQELPGGRVTIGSNEPNSMFGEYTTKTLG